MRLEVAPVKKISQALHSIRLCDFYIVLLYLKAQLDHWTGKDGYEDIMKTAYKLALKYLSPYGGFYGIEEYIRPNYRLLSDIIFWLKISYDSADAGDVYDAALF